MNVRRLVLGTSVVVGLLVLLGLGWYWQRPIRVANSATAKLAAAHTQRFTAVTKLGNPGVSQQLLGEEGEVEIKVDGTFVRQADERDKLAMTATITSRTESVTVEIDGELRFVDENAYVLITKAPQAIPGLKELKGIWLKLPRGGTQEAQASPTEEALFQSVKRSGQEKVDGKSVVKYNATATAAAIVRMLDQMADLLGTRLTSEQINGIRASLQQTQEVPVELWITPWTHELRQLHTTLTMPGGNSVDFVLTLRGRNKAADITAPDGALTPEEIVQQLQQGGSNAQQ